MIKYDDVNLFVNGKPFMFVPTEINEYDVTGYYFGKYKTLPVTPNDFAPRIQLLFDDYSPYFTVDDSFSKSISLEMLEDLKLMGHLEHLYEAKVITINVNRNNHEAENILEYYSKYKSPMPLEKMEEYYNKLDEIKEDFK